MLWVVLQDGGLLSRPPVNYAQFLACEMDKLDQHVFSRHVLAILPVCFVHGDEANLRQNEDDVIMRATTLQQVLSTVPSPPQGLRARMIRVLRVRKTLY